MSKTCARYAKKGSASTASAAGIILSRVWQAPELGILLALFIVCAFFSILAPSFTDRYNLLQTTRSFSAIAIMALGQTLVILTGGIDLSVGSMLGLSACVTALSMAAGHSVLISICAGLATGSIFGMINGLLVTRAKLPPFIVTLGTMSIGRSLAYVSGCFGSLLPKPPPKAAIGRRTRQSNVQMAQPLHRQPRALLHRHHNRMAPPVN